MKKESSYIGVIDFTNIKKNRADIGLYSNPQIYGNGSLLMEIICDYGFNTLKIKKLVAEVFVSNKKAFNLYNKFNFKETGTKIINNKEVICMELKNENR